MQQLRKDNHYVPQVYLKQWATNDRILTYSLLVPHQKVPLWRRRSLKGIAFHRHLYTQIVGGAESDAFERWLDSEFEAPAESAISRAVSDQRLSVDDWQALIRFAIAQDVRTPVRLRDFLQRQSQEMPPLLNKALHEAVAQLEQDGLSVRPGKTTSVGDFPLRLSVEEQPNGEGILRAETVVGREMWLWSLRHLLTNTLAKISNKGWSILRSSKGCSWPTSDSPLIRLNYFNGGQYNFDGGWGVPNGDVLLPLSPTHLLHRSGGKRSLVRGHRLDVSVSKQVRRIIVEHADRYVFAREEGDIHEIRERAVSLELYNAEKAAWANWHSEQSKVETV